MHAVAALPGWYGARDATGLDGYWNENSKTRNYPVVRAKGDYHSLGGCLENDDEKAVLAGYFGFIRLRSISAPRTFSVSCYDLAGRTISIQASAPPWDADLFEKSAGRKYVFPLLVEEDDKMMHLGLFRISKASTVSGRVIVDLAEVERGTDVGLPALLPSLKRGRLAGFAPARRVPLVALGRGCEVAPLFLKTVGDAKVNLRMCIFLLDSPAFEKTVADAAKQGAAVRVLLNAVVQDRRAHPPQPGAVQCIPSSWLRLGGRLEVRSVGEIAKDAEEEGTGGPAIFHAKLVIADANPFGSSTVSCLGRYAMGSANPTRPGFSYNVECAVRSEEPTCEASALAVQFDRLWDAWSSEAPDEDPPLDTRESACGEMAACVATTPA
jgi:hypothetical protein